MENPIKKQALYPLLQHYTGSEIVNLFFDNDKAFFDTKYGQSGKLLESDNGDWKILIDGEEIGSIEKIVFDVLINPDKKSTLEDYLKKLIDVLDKENLKYRSRILISQTLKVLEGYIINSDFIPKKTIKAGPFCVFGHKNHKFVFCLN
jgi:hypothetical protein